MGKTDGLKPFKKGKSGNPNGRPKKLIGDVIAGLKKAGYKPVSASEVKEISEYLLGLDDTQLSELENDDATPKLLKLCIKALNGKKGFDAVQTLLDRAHGKATQKMEVGGEIATPTVISVRTEELDDFLEKLKAKENGRT